MPPLSVVMPVHNALPYLDEAIASVTCQAFGDFEFLIFDDGSTDGSVDCLRGWAGRDRRIRLVEGGQRIGPARSSARAVAEAAAPVIARMDADDVSHPDRLKRQLAALEAQPGAGMVAALCETMSAQGSLVRLGDPWRLTHPSPLPPFSHGSIMFRRAVYERAGGYGETCDFWEDIDLCLRMARTAPVLVIPEALYVVRLAETSTRLTSQREEVEAAYGLMFRCIAEFRQGRPFDHLLHNGTARPAAGRIAPEALILMSSQPLWAGERPRILGRMLRRTALGWNRASAAALTWGLWASTSPATLRAFLRLHARLRNAAARRRIGNAPYVEWRPAAAVGGNN